MEEIEWIVLPDIIRLGLSLFKDLEETKLERRAERAITASDEGTRTSSFRKRKERRSGLMETDPW